MILKNKWTGRDSNPRPFGQMSPMPRERSIVQTISGLIYRPIAFSLTIIFKNLLILNKELIKKIKIKKK